jgi:hypothetical protein
MAQTMVQGLQGRPLGVLSQAGVEESFWQAALGGSVGVGSGCFMGGCGELF